MTCFRGLRFWLAGLLLLLAACSSGPGMPERGGVFPSEDAVPGWKISQETKTYAHDQLYELVDGQADAFFAYGFNEAAVRRYQNGQGNQINVEVWRLETPADSCGLFLSNQSGQAEDMGSEGALNPGRRLSFWQDRYYSAITANESVPDETLRSFAEAVSLALPNGGECSPVLKRLPPEGLIPRSSLFFHQEISIQNALWLGGSNLLNLNEKTAGALGQYERGGKKYTLLVVQYPGAGEAAAALQALETAAPAGFVAAGVRENLLGAVFGEVEKPAAQGLIAEALR
jgi:hypothetical protein